MKNEKNPKKPKKMKKKEKKEPRQFWKKKTKSKGQGRSGLGIADETIRAAKARARDTFTKK